MLQQSRKREVCQACQLFVLAFNHIHPFQFTKPHNPSRAFNKHCLSDHCHKNEQPTQGTENGTAHSVMTENALSSVKIALCIIWSAKLATVFRQQMRIQGFNIVLQKTSNCLSILINVKQEVLINYFQTLPGGLNRTHLTEEEAKEKYYQYWERQQVAKCC